MAPQRKPNSLPSRRGRQVAPIQTQLPIPPSRSQRPRPAEDPLSAHTAERVPLQPPSVKRQSSMKGFRNIFSRNKSTQASNRGQGLPAVEESQDKTTNHGAPAVVPKSPATPHTAAKTETPTQTTPATPAPSTLTQKERNQPKSLSKRPKEKPPRTITSWDPPPLFQAYPQAVKHVSLLAPKISSDAILRISGNRPNGNGAEDATNTSPENESAEKDDLSKKQKKREKKHSRRVSISITKAEWTQKIYVLVTSGYLLQYTGEGHFDRLPEKMMQLSKDSVAFASDAIPGKHWVLQVSQAMDDEGTMDLEKPKSLLSRLGFQSSDSRRATKSFLMVLNNPEDMNSWLVVVRREIEALGGTKYIPETPLSGTFGNQLQNKPSLKYLIKRDSLRSPKPRLETKDKGSKPNASLPPAEKSPRDQKKAGDVTPVKSVKRQSMPTRPSVDAPSLSTLATSTDLDRLRESSRFSYVSAGTRTIPSSRGSSPSDSPSKPNFTVSRRPNLDPCAAFKGTATPAVTSSSIARHSMQSHAPAQTELKPPEVQTTPSSVLTASPPISRNGSPAPPNFSVPSFSKRFSLPTTSPNLPPPSPDSIRRSPRTSPIPGQSSPQEADECQTSGSDSIPRSTDTPRSKPLSYEGDAASTSSLDTHGPTRTPSVRSSSSASGRTRPKRLPPADHSMRNYRSSHPPLSTIALPELSPLDDEFPSTGSTRSRRGSYPYRNSKYSTSSPKPNRPSRHSTGMQVKLEASTHSPSPSPSPSHVSRINKTRHASLYFLPQAHAQGATTTEGTTNSAAAAQSRSAKRLASRKSLPEFPFGPPVAPPPDCPLPEVPPIVVSQFQSARQESPSIGGNVSTLSRRSTTIGRSRSPNHTEPSVQSKYSESMRNLDDDLGIKDRDAIYVH